MDRGAWWATVHGAAKSWMPFTQYIMSDYQEKNYRTYQKQKNLHNLKRQSKHQKETDKAGMLDVGIIRQGI